MSRKGEPLNGGSIGKKALFSFIRVWSLKQSFNRFALSISSVNTEPLISSGGILDFEFDEMKVLRVLHQSLEDSGCDFNLMDSFSLIFRFDSRIKETTLLRIRLNLAH